MSQDKELEIRRQFLDEAQEYLDTLDSALLGLANRRVDSQIMNAALRAAHSIKGGAGMMGFQLLSQLAHRLEDSFKVLKTQKQSIDPDAELETLLIAAVDCLRRVIGYDRQDTFVTQQWIETEATPIFDQLQERLGEPQAEDAVSLLSPEDGQNIVPLLFETEVEGCLQRLEGVLADSNQPCLQEELTILAQELGGLGEMLQLPAFSSLCESVLQAIEESPSNLGIIAQSALQTWRRSQALVLAGQLDSLPAAIEPESSFPAQVPEESLLGEMLEHEPIDRQADWLADHDAADPPRLVTPQTAEANWQASQPVEISVQPDLERLAVQPDPATASEEDLDATVRVPVRQLNRLNDLFGELTIERNGLDLYLKRLRNLTLTLSQRVRLLEQSNDRVRNAYDKTTVRADHNNSRLVGAANRQFFAVRATAANGNDFQGGNRGFDALEMDRYSDLHLLSQAVMEMIVQIQEVTGDIDLSLDDAEQTTRELNKTAKQLQTNLTQLRMRPLSDVVDRFPKALRELSLRYGKPVRLNILGGGTLIDRNILELLNDPLMHLLRNAFDHGIEDSETRKAGGKPETGVIEIRATHRGNRTLITLRDDGGGIPLDKILAKAQQMGLDPTLLAAASDQELLSLIFEPGFSTTDRVTALSGRGVGLDVVRDNLKQIRGEISVDTSPGLGTTFTISIPFTISVVRVLLAESNGLLLALPTDIVEEMILLKSEQLITTADSEVLNWQGNLVSLIRLDRWLHFNCPHHPHVLETPPTINIPSVLLVTQGTQLVGLQVDRCWGEQEVAVRRVEGSLSLPPGFTNCTIMGDGRVVPLVNLSELLHWIASCGSSSQNQPATVPATLPQLPQPEPSVLEPETTNWQPINSASILIVDDSINVRRLLALTLERAGYRVEQAKDGQDALEKLHGGLRVHAIVCDIEMPRLDGFGLLAKAKATPALEPIPIAMLTSRSGDKHRQLAISLGASAYFSKPYNEQALLQTLQRLVNEAAII